MRRPTIILKYQNDKTVLYGNMICLNFTVKRSQTDFQQACRFRFIAFGVLQDFRDVLLFNYRQFKFFSPLLFVNLSTLQVYRQILNSHFLITDDGTTLHHILQFTDISLPFSPPSKCVLPQESSL